MIDISVVMITHNQQWNVRRLIESVITGTKGIEACEIVLVDSASSDHTTDIACLYPINVVRLQPNQALSPAAGRYVGYLYTSGNFILYLDGDMSLSVGWLQQALVLMKKRIDIASISGEIIDRSLEATDLPGIQHERKEAAESAEEISACGGAALYRRTVLAQVGPFNPYLLSDEEPELCFRIRNAGYKIVRLDIPLAYHFTAPSDKISTILGRRERKLYRGVGQNLRGYLGTTLFWPYLFEHGYICPAVIGTLTGIFSLLLSISTHSWYWFVFWVMLFSGFICSDIFRKKSIYRTLFSLVRRLIVLEAILRGFFMPQNLPHTYPANVDILK